MSSICTYDGYIALNALQVFFASQLESNDFNVFQDVIVFHFAVLNVCMWKVRSRVNRDSQMSGDGYTTGRVTSVKWSVFIHTYVHVYI